MLFSMTNGLIWQAEVSLLLSEKDINYKKTAPTRKCVGASCFYRFRIVNVLLCCQHKFKFVTLEYIFNAHCKTSLSLPFLYRVYIIIYKL